MTILDHEYGELDNRPLEKYSRMLLPKNRKDSNER